MTLLVFGVSAYLYNMLIIVDDVVVHVVVLFPKLVLGHMVSETVFGTSGIRNGFWDTWFPKRLWSKWFPKRFLGQLVSGTCSRTNGFRNGFGTNGFQNGSWDKLLPKRFLGQIVSETGFGTMWLLTSLAGKTDERHCFIDRKRRAPLSLWPGELINCLALRLLGVLSHLGKM